MAEPPFGHEPSRIAVQRVLGVGAVLAVGVIVTVIAVCLVLQHRLEPARARFNAASAVIPPAPRLQPRPAADLAELRAQKQALLEGWGWTDRTRQFARIPIERAMAIYARQAESHRVAAVAATRAREKGR
jgi:hypothetical protein